MEGGGRFLRWARRGREGGSFFSLERGERGGGREEFTAGMKMEYGG